MNISNKLNRFKSHLTKNKGLLDKIDPQYNAKASIPYKDDWNAMAALPNFFEDEYIFIREKAYPLNYQHGIYQFNELYDVVEEWGRKKITHPLSAMGTNPKDLVFFDTETTGLNGGAGNTIFLIGTARVDQTKVIVKQFFLPKPNAEVAFYHHFLSEIDGLENLVTYNGRAFDWPQVKTRHTFVRDLVPNLPTFGHFDLLHASRRLWKDKLSSVKLSMVEKEILQIKRHDDVPGYLAPMIYFDFLKDQNPNGVKGILAHNEWDVLSLITLYIHLSRVVLNTIHEPISTKETYEVARWFEALGQRDLAISYYTVCTNSENGCKNLAMKGLGRILKKQGKLNEAVHIWSTLLENDNFYDEEVAVELAKIYEHHYKDLEKAMYYATHAYQVWKKKRVLLNGKQVKKTDEFGKRLQRLEKKISIKKEI